MSLFDLIVKRALQKNVLELVDGNTYVFFVPDNSYASELNNAFTSVFEGKDNPPKVLILQVGDRTKEMKVVNIG